MQNEIHPEYRNIVFEDAGAGFRILTRSTMSSSQTTKWEDGQEYPVVQVDISSASHPFYTGKQKIIDTAGRVDRFERKYGKRRTPAADTSGADKA